MPKKVKRKKGRVIWVLADIYHPSDLFPEWYRSEQEAKDNSNGHRVVKFVECLT
jgi:hypothetical protein